LLKTTRPKNKLGKRRFIFSTLIHTHIDIQSLTATTIITTTTKKSKSATLSQETVTNIFFQYIGEMLHMMFVYKEVNPFHGEVSISVKAQAKKAYTHTKEKKCTKMEKDEKPYTV
jgi:hypothetical protein